MARLGFKICELILDFRLTLLQAHLIGSHACHADPKCWREHPMAFVARRKHATDYEVQVSGAGVFEDAYFTWFGEHFTWFAEWKL